jgi:hypothetical protein
MEWLKLRHYFRTLLFVIFISYGALAGLTGSAFLSIGVLSAQTGGAVPGNLSGNIGDAEIGRGLRDSQFCKILKLVFSFNLKEIIGEHLRMVHY